MIMTIVNVAAIGAVSLYCMSCSKENQDGTNSTTQSAKSIAADVEAGSQDQLEIDGGLSAEWEAAKGKIKVAIKALGSRTHDDASLSIEDLISGKGLQFFRIPGQPITLFLPLKGLNDEEAKRAESYFAEIGISTVDYAGYQSYLVDFDQDHERAANTAVDVYMKIYQITDNFNIQFSEC